MRLFGRAVLFASCIASIAHAREADEPSSFGQGPKPEQSGTTFTIYAFGASGAFDGRSLRPAADEPDPLKGRNVRVEGGGMLIGGGLRGAYLFPSGRFGRFRIGGGLSAYGFRDLDFRYDPLAEGLWATTGKAWALGTEFFVGDELAIGRVHPYVDLFANVGLLSTNVTLHSPTLGALGSTSYLATSIGFGPRAGVQIPVSDTVYLDLGVYTTAFGVERFGAFVGFAGRKAIEESVEPDPKCGPAVEAAPR